MRFLVRYPAGVESTEVARAFAKSALQCLAAALSARGWIGTINPAAVEVEACRGTPASADQVVSFAAIYNKSDAVCFQAGVGIRLHDVNKVLGELRGSDASRQLTAYALVNHLAPQVARRQGWCFSPSPKGDLSSAAELIVQEVLALSEVQALLSSVVDVASYIAAVEQARWPFLSVQEQYIAALIVVGRMTDAVRAAEKGERDYIDTVSSRGIAIREADLVFVRKVRKLQQ